MDLYWLWEKPLKYGIFKYTTIYDAEEQMDVGMVPEVVFCTDPNIKIGFEDFIEYWEKSKNPKKIIRFLFTGK